MKAFISAPTALTALAILAQPASAGTLGSDFSFDNGVSLSPGFVPPAPGFFSAGTYSLDSDDPFTLNLSAIPSGSVGSYSLLINFVNQTSRPITQVRMSVDGPARIGDAFALSWDPIYGPADASSSTQANFILDAEWGDTLSASTLFELEVLDPVDSPEITITFEAVPEPSTAVVVLCGLCLIGRRTNRARRRG